MYFFIFRSLGLKSLLSYLRQLNKNKSYCSTDFAVELFNLKNLLIKTEIYN